VKNGGEIMSKTEQTTKNEETTKSDRTTTDIFAVYDENVDKYYDNVEKSIPKYSQAIEELQQEYLQTYENVTKATLSLQKEFLKKTGWSTNFPEATQKVFQDTTDAFVKARSVRDQVILATIDTAKQNIKTWNDNAKTFADLNRNVLQTWSSLFTVSKTNE